MLKTERQSYFLHGVNPHNKALCSPVNHVVCDDTSRHFMCGGIHLFIHLSHPNIERDQVSKKSKEIPSYLTTANKGKIRVKKADGTIVTWDGTNASAMVGFWMVENAQNRTAFTDRSYMAPVGQSQIIQYEEKGFNLTQTKGW